MSLQLPIPDNTPVTIAGSSTPVQIYGGSGAATAATFTLKGNSVAPDSLLEITGLCNFLLPNTGGRALTMSIGGALVMQSFPTATMGALQFKQMLYVSPDLKSVDLYTQNANDVLSPTAGQGAPFSAHLAVKTTLAIDMTADQPVLIQLAPVAGDIAELSAWSIVNHRAAANPTRSFAPANALWCPGNSLSAGTGSVSPSGGWVSQLRISRAGQVIVNGGIGGQTSTQILARILADKVRGRYWNCIFEMGRNDAWSTAPQQAAIVANIQAAVANLAPGVKFIVCTVTPGANEGPGTGNWTSLQALNALILAAFPSNTADIFAAVTAGGTANVPLANRAVTASTTGTWASASTSVTVASATGIVNGMFVLGAGIPTGTTCTISGTTLTLSAATTAAGSATALTFVGATEGHFNDIGYGVWKTTIQTLMTTLGM